MTELSAFSAEMMTHIPRLRAFGMSLSGSLSAADDLVQETVMKAWTHRESYSPGTNMRAWLYTILRNTFRSQRRKFGREVRDDGRYAAQVSTPPAQIDRLHLIALSNALTKLPPDQREALVLVTVSGCSYQEAARICGVAEGTIKSRVNRARRKLVCILGMADANDIGPEGSDLAALSSVARETIT